VEDAPIFTGLSNTGNCNYNCNYNSDFFFFMCEYWIIILIIIIINIFIDVLSISLSDYPKWNMPDKINSTCPTLEVRKKLFHTTTSATSSQSIVLKIVTILSLV